MALIISACTNEAPVEPSSMSDSQSTSNKRSETEAVEIAESLALTLAESRSKAKNAESIEIISGSNSQSNNDTLIYAVNYENNEGYALISAIKSGISVIGFTEEGSFNKDLAEKNPNFDFFLSIVENYISTLNDDGKEDLTPNPSTPVKTTTLAIRATKAKWGQYYPEGMYCPNRVAGCVQTAIAQMMSYFKEPTSIKLTYPERDCETLSLNWTEINKHTVSSSTSNKDKIICNASEYSHTSIGKICRELGYRNNANYKTSSTSTHSGVALETFESLMPGYWFSDLKPLDNNEQFEELASLFFDHKGLAYIKGGGHAWICEGVKEIKTEVKEPLINGEYRIHTSYEYFFLYNWGWCGQDNGYFAAGVFDNKKPSRSRGDYSNDPAYCYVYKK